MLLLVMNTYTVLLKRRDSQDYEGLHLYQKEYPINTPTDEALLDFLLDLQTNGIEMPKGTEIQIGDPD